MNRQIIDEKTGIDYSLHDNYYLPNFVLPAEEEQHIGIWGQRRRHYLKKHHRILYYNLLTACKLNDHLSDVDRQAEELFSRLVKQMAEREVVTEALKAQDQMAWGRRMNNIRSRAMEITNNDLIYS